MASEVKADHTGFTFTSILHSDTYSAIDPTQWDLSGKVVFITGASRGIGRATAISFARAGASGIAIGARSTKALEEVEKAVIDAAQQTKGKGSTPKVLRLSLDVTDETSVDAAAKAARETFGRLDILVNNAGYLEDFKETAKADVKDWWTTWTVNIKGTFLVTRALLPLLLESEDSLKVIVNVTSVAAHLTSATGTGYHSSKLALLRFGEILESEYGAQGVIPIAYNPGAVQTEMADKLPKHFGVAFVDTPELAADTIVWTSKERRQWLSGRYVSCNWDVTELESRKDEIVKGDKLKVKMIV